MRKENKQRKGFIPLIAILALFLIAGIAGGTYAYWAGTVNAPTDATKNIVINSGKGGTVNTTIELNDPAAATKKLVPAGKAASSVGGEADNAEELVFTYNVKWTGAGAEGTLGTLSVSTGTILIGGAPHAVSGLVKVNISFTPDIEVGAEDAVVVTVKITLTEPSYTTYDDIANKAITIPLTFAIALLP